MTYKIGILTPYLSQSEDWFRKRCNDKGMCSQKEKYGLDLATSFHTDRDLPNTDVELILGLPPVLFELPKDTVFAVVGSDRNSQEVVNHFRHTSLHLGLKIPVARFSIFYGNANGYDESLPQDTGYALDIPKNNQLVRRLCVDESVLEALFNRDLDMLVGALDEFNSGEERPVLVTPYLAQLWD